MRQRTLAIIKPDAVAQGNSGLIITLIERNKFIIARMQKMQLAKKQAELFYEIHKDKPFYHELVDLMLQGPAIIMVLERDNAIVAWRELMGVTDPAKADFGTLRRMFGTSIGSNGFHGSDAPETAQKELRFFFPDL